MRFLRRNSTQSDDAAADDGPDADIETDSHAPRGYTPAKGRATPKRKEAEGKRRGPVAPPPRTTREAIRRNRELRKQNPVTKDERRAAAKERRERMMAGDERYLLPRDRGPVKAYVRDLVDSRRNILGLFMPLAILVFVSLLVPVPAVQQYATLGTTVMLLGMVVEGFLNGRRIAKLARERFPKETIKGGSIGWYSFVRASQIRKLRMPKPRLRPGDPIP
ncbi:hypothetical protein BAY61_07575 [Prauserella marina]|uniref:Uncharacterized protein n=1 Tax=Prauserella marina TaxID=530584 RepID=A0A222VMB3_9PSEU|nr:DUF3043 domain-containing protein [Prauserella marina]ASR34861.1 hypothetical protein BAY61_07575 [Prauserella marina]PWV85442.1 hypothetical protein DES30_1011469 [Prauserella marina]SDC54718.1 Protein of unknown function [Prauserella marina]